MEGTMGDNVIQSGHEALDISQHNQPQLAQLDQSVMQDSNGNTTNTVCVALKQEVLEKGPAPESPSVQPEHQDGPHIERICSISGESVEMNAAGATPGTMLVASSRPGEIPIIVPSGKTIFLSDQFTAVLIRPESLLYGMEVPVIKKENSDEHVVAVSTAQTQATVGTSDSSAVQVPWFLQVGHNPSEAEHSPNVTTEDPKDVVEPLVTAPDAASATPKTPYMFTSKDRTFTCEFCPNITFTRGQLRKHKTVHTGQRNYVCGVCNKRFAVKHSLVKHMVLHSGQSPYTCDQCGKGFSSAYHLQHHARSHDPERQYKCSQCDKMFAKPDHLVVHIRTHNGEETFPCNECEKSFTTKLGLNTHMRVHSGATSMFTCGVCGAQLPTYGDLVAHAKAHGEQEQAALMGAHECVVVVDENDRTRTEVVPNTVSAPAMSMPVVTSVNGVGSA